MANFFKSVKPVVLLIMDGVGVASIGPGNAVTLADTPNLDSYWPKYPHTYLQAAGRDVGLPNGVDGNSEVGHMTLGTGKVIFQELPRIDNSIESGAFFRNDQLIKAIEHAKRNKGNLHIIGLVGTGSVHSNINHLYKLIELLKREDVDGDKVFVHAFTDGRDSSPSAAAQLLEDLEGELERKRVGRIASFIGRYYAMDRDERWERTQMAYDLITKGEGKKIKKFKDAIKESYDKGVTDEYMKAYALEDFEGKVASVKPGDSVINFNFRPDRALQITRAFEEEDFKGFKREKIENLYYVGFTDYKKGFPKNVAFPPDKTFASLGKVLSENKIRQLRIAESEKFPHVTYFFDGGKQVIYPGEDQIEVPSPKDVATYDQAPTMSTEKILKVVLDKLESKKYDFFVINFAAPDMVAHTGVLDAAIKAMNATDSAVGQIVSKVLSMDGAVLITSDHGNCEEMVNLRTGEVDTKHSINPVPFLAIKKDFQPRELPFGILADVAPTILGLFGIEKPIEMTGRNLLG